MNSKRQVLIVEDSRVQAEMLKRFLESRGLSVTVTENGSAALSKLESGLRPDVVISDIEMPEMNGYELCAALRRNPEFQTLPVILLTVLSNARDVVAGLNSGADSYVTKPYNDELLLARIESLCARPPELRRAVEGEEITIKIGSETFAVRAAFRRALDLLVSTYENAVDQNRQLREATAKLSAQKKDLEELVEIKNRFLGMAAHDLRNPLYAIHGYSLHLKKSFSDRASSREKDICDGIIRSSDFMAGLVENLLTVITQESGKVELVMGEIPLRELIAKQIDLNRPLAEEKTIEILFEPGSDPIQVWCDENKIIQVINNLVSNAVKFSLPEAEISVECRVEGKFVQVSVRDQGQGIAEEELDKLFLPFSRTSTTPTAGERSTGLGLAICKNIIDAHGGVITAESKVGEGSVFSFTLPLSDT